MSPAKNLDRFKGRKNVLMHSLHLAYAAGDFPCTGILAYAGDPLGYVGGTFPFSFLRWGCLLLSNPDPGFGDQECLNKPKLVHRAIL